jgi:dTDP-glucose 4,6-dehydratase
MNPLVDDLDHVLAHTQGIWEELRGKRLFITGGTGFFGCWLLESFLWANEKLKLQASAVVLTRNAEAFRQKAPHLAGNPAIRLHPGDIKSFAFPSGEFSHVLHAATEATAKLNEEDPLALYDTIVTGTRRALEFARQAGARRFLLTSSGAVYGRQPSELTHAGEDFSGGPDPTQPRWTYGEGKRAAELLCSLYAKQHGLEPTIARCFAFVGPYLPLDIHFAVGNFIRDGLQGGPIRVNGDGTPFRSYLYAADLAVWLWTILLRVQPVRAYNVGSEAGLPISEVARRVGGVFEPRIAVQIAKAPPPGQPPERYVPATVRARSELGLGEMISLEEAVRRTIRWHLGLGKARG